MAEALGTVASIIQLVDTALKAREYIKDFRDAPKEQQKLFLEMEGLRPLLAELLKRLVDNPSSEAFQQMTAPLKIFETTMKEFTEKLGPRDAMSKFTRKITWTLWSKKEAGGYLEELERIKGLINVWLTMGIWDLGLKQIANQADILDLSQKQISNQGDILLSINDVVHNQREYISAEKQRAILDWISPLNFLQRQADVFSTLQPGTGEWLLADAQFQDWESGSGKILWCPGMPGAGKTVLTSLVFNYLEVQAQKNNIGLACIYLNHKETESQTLANLLGALWKQLMLEKSIPLAVDTLYDHHCMRQTRPHLDEFRKALNFAITQYPKVYFILDALDEYPEDIRHLFLQYLVTLGPKVNIMMTSRPHIGLDSVVPDFQILEIKATDDDICRYLSTQIERSPRLSRHVKARPDLQEDIQSKIVANCKGMFLLAKLHIESLASKNAVKAVREALEHLPTDLQQTYDEAMARIKLQQEENRELGLLALTWVANAKRLLSVSELQEALAIEEDSTSLDPDNLLDISTILSVCAGLIIVDETLSVVRLIHYTTQGYMDNIQSDQFPLAQTTIVSTCLTYLSFKEFENLPPMEEQEVQDDLISNHPFLKYAQYCLLHTKGQPELQLQNKIKIFLAVEAGKWKDSDVWPGVAPWAYDGDFEKETDYFHALWIAATCNLEIIVSDLLTQVDLATEAIDQALYAASYRGHSQIVQLLINKGADVNTQGGHVGNALRAASYNGHELVVQHLLNKGADVNAQGGYYGDALQAASYNGHELVVQHLLNKGADVNAQGGYYGDALQAASLNGHELVVQLLIDKGADVNAQGGWYGNALQAASYRGHELVVQLLLDKGADVNAQGGYYGNALQAASLNGHELVVQLLLDKGADVNAQGGYYGNALQAASYNQHELVVQLLLDKGADVNAQGGYYGNALQAASLNGHELMVQLLIDKGADVNTQGGNAGNALQAASLNGHELVVQLLIDKGADVNAQGANVGNALQAASFTGHELVVQLLIDKGADVNAQGGYYGDALQAASYNGHELVVQLLIDKGADVNAQGGYYGDALQAASYNGHELVVQHLLNKGCRCECPGSKCWECTAGCLIQWT
ncbi:ankyrin repeat domain-containing protein [Mycena vulgaris]|nr:ankyrin repeat domain-containing protein [Mycena vulgaris]